MASATMMRGLTQSWYPGVEAALAALLLAGCGGHTDRRTWPLPGADLAATRAAAGSTITAGDAHRLRFLWRARLAGAPAGRGVVASAPVVGSQSVYVEDLRSDVYSLDRRTGTLRWAQRYRAAAGPANGVAVDGGRVYGTAVHSVFALAELNGRELWRTGILRRTRMYVTGVPIPWQGLVLVTAAAPAPEGQAAIYGLDAATGRIRWRTAVGITPPTGASPPIVVGSDGHIYVGAAAPATSGLVALDAASGKVLWRVPAAVGARAVPDAPVVLGDKIAIVAGAAGRVGEWDTHARRARWMRILAVGACRHARREMSPLPALAGGLVFIPLADSCRGRRSGSGAVVAVSTSTGAVRWTHRVAAPDVSCAAAAHGVVFASTSSGVLYGLDGRTGRVVWKARLGAGADSCTSVAGATIFATARAPRGGRHVPQVVAFGLGD
jgi:outer membrane protein assembly factor BamB